VQIGLDSPPVTLTGARGQGVRILIVGLLMLFGGALGVAAGPHGRAAGVFCFGVGLVFVALGISTLAAPTQLVLEPDALKIRGAFRTRSFRWDEVANFRVVQVRKAQMIGFDRPGRTAGGGMFRDVGLALTVADIPGPFDGIVPGVWPGDSARAAAEQLSAARERWAGAPAPVAQRTSNSSGKRINRQVYWIAVATLVLTTMFFTNVLHISRGGAGGFSLVWIWLYARRLHDIGHSGWWQAAVFGGQVFLGVVLMAGLHLPTAMAIGVIGLIQIAFTVALGAIAGEAAENRFGAPPGAPLGAPVAVI
jgi:uncharacterized membrane protein YhaH (DUF805 family)